VCVMDPMDLGVGVGHTGNGNMRGWVRIVRFGCGRGAVGHCH